MEESCSLVNLQKRGFSSTPPGVHWAFPGRMDSQLKEGDRILEMGTIVMKKVRLEQLPFRSAFEGQLGLAQLSLIDSLGTWSCRTVITREGPCPHITKRNRMLHCTVAIPHKVTQQVTKACILGAIDSIREQQGVVVWSWESKRRVKVFRFKIAWKKPFMATHTCNPTSWEMEAKGSRNPGPSLAIWWVWGQPGLCEILSQVFFFFF